MTRFASLLSLVIWSSSHLVIPTVLASTRDELKQTESELSHSKAREAELSARKRQADSDMGDARENLVKIARAMQELETELSDSEEKLSILREQITGKQTVLKVQREKLAALISASLKLQQTPPEAAVLMPGDFGEAMKASRALALVSGRIKEESAAAAEQLEALNGMQARAESQHKAILEKQQALDEKRALMTRQLAARKEMMGKLERDHAQESARAANLARKSADLKGLLEKLEQEKAAQQRELSHGREVTQSGRAPSGKIGSRGELRSFASAHGRIRAPVAGRLTRGYGVALGQNETTRGITIATRDFAPVTAPYDGEVVFTGPFMNYGKLVILRHADGYHTLLAGLSKIDVAPGQFLLEGEPVGAMGESDTAPKLYVELRKDNQPVDPGGWIRGI